MVVGRSDARKQVPKAGRRGFDSLVILVSWIVWKERNDRTFDRYIHTIDEVVRRALDEILAWSLAGFRQLELALSVLGLPAGRDLIGHVIE